MKIIESISKIRKGKFACKVGSVEEIREHWSQVENEDEAFQIEEMVIMSNEEFEAFANDLLVDKEFLEGKGGTNSTTMPEGIEDKKFWELTESEIKQFQRGAYRVCVGVTSLEADYTIVVDPQGYNYARYSTIIEG